jgi:hypothetical protein
MEPEEFNAVPRHMRCTIGAMEIVSCSLDGDPGASSENIPGKVGKLGVGFVAAVDVGVVQIVTIATPRLW